MDSVLPFETEVRVRPRGTRLGLRVLPGGRVTLMAPAGLSRGAILRFVHRHRAWIERTRERLARLPVAPSVTERRLAYLRHKEAARRLAYVLIARFASVYGVAVRSVSIRDQKTRWGSCSRDGRLAFNYRLALLSERLAEYVVVHELCHLREFNHSRRFWSLVARAVPEHREARRRLRIEHALG